MKKDVGQWKTRKRDWRVNVSACGFLLQNELSLGFQHTSLICHELQVLSICPQKAEWINNESNMPSQNVTSTIP